MIISFCRPNVLLWSLRSAGPSCKNGIMIILPNLQDKVSCKYKVLQVHTEMSMYPKYQRMESGIEAYKIKNEVEGNYKTIESLTKQWQK